MLCFVTNMHTIIKCERFHIWFPFSAFGIGLENLINLLMDCAFVIVLFRWSLGAFYLMGNWSLILDQHLTKLFSVGFLLPAVRQGALNPLVGMEARRILLPRSIRAANQAFLTTLHGNELT